MNNRPKYLIKVHQSWNYGPRARFWSIQKWYDNGHGGWWTNVGRGGLAYSERGMWRAINKRLKQMEFGSVTKYYTVDQELVKHPNCSDADTDNCPPNDPNCIWQTYQCRWCNKAYKISKRALTGKYMISDHNKTCKEFKKNKKNIDRK